MNTLKELAIAAAIIGCSIMVIYTVVNYMHVVTSFANQTNQSVMWVANK